MNKITLMPHYNCAVVLGATATGKTAFAVKLAQAKGGEIISADSRQVYRGLDLGTGKDLREYGSVPYHLIDVCDLSREFTVFHFQKEVYRIFPQLVEKGALPIIAGGTGLYLDAILRGYELIPVPEDPILRKALAAKTLAELQDMLVALKPDIHNKTDLEQPDRLVRAIEIARYRQEHPESAAAHLHAAPSIKPKIYGISFERSVLRERIRRRLIARIDAGMIEETEQIHAQGYSWERLESLGLEYRFTAQYLQGKIESKEAYIEQLYRAIGQFAKRQETWFRRMARNGIEIEWIDGNKAAQLTAAVISEMGHFL
ncbi:tRNA (adenosine(37)-N6)-dimethylallyltransferase MiaA [Treponema vincentii]|uniref:tRNA (adenosine(37)-N6)-dimethylallyltransferase MiaA n=1 Tax=Treponema vincentii TaxID=69710 RepID=UPI001E5C2FBA|nr:tRNA (adenosine(37)-N6)-dimethylallyltransferase MiaA [Treponema vincentii]